MAFAASGFKTLIQGGAGQLHYYQSGADALATVIASGYFNSITDSLKNGDVILCFNTGSTLIDVLVVNSATKAATVTVVNGT